MKTIRIFIYGAILMLAGWSCGNSSDQINPADVVNNPNTANGKVNSDALPVFAFKEDKWDFGKIGQGEVVTHVFEFINTG